MLDYQHLIPDHVVQEACEFGRANGAGIVYLYAEREPGKWQMHIEDECTDWEFHAHPVAAVHVLAEKVLLTEHGKEQLDKALSKVPAKLKD